MEYIGALDFNATLLKSVYLPDSVVKLGQAAFIGVPIKSIEFPSTLKTIGRMAFSSTRLESVHIPSNVEVIESNAFKQNLKFRTLKQVTFEEGLKNIGEGAFMDGMISEVNLPNSLEALGENSFKGNINSAKEPIIVKLHTTNVEHLNFETMISKEHQKIIFKAPTTETYALIFNVEDESGAVVDDATIQVKDSEENVVEDLSAVEIGEYSYTVSKAGYVNSTGTVVVSDGDISRDITLITEVASEFEIDENGVVTKYNGIQTQIVIPNEVDLVTVTGIGDKVFFNKSLTSVEIPDTVISIGVSAFSKNNLTSISLPNNLKTIKTGAFSSNKLTELIIPGSVEVVEGMSFAVNSNLESVVLEEGVKEISANAFTNNKALTGKIILPSTLEHLWTSAFKGTNVTSLYIAGGKDSSLIHIHSGTSPVLEEIKFESPYKAAYIVFNASANLNIVDLGAIDYSGAVEELQTFLQDNLSIKESAYHVNKEDYSGKSDIVILADIEWNLEGIDLSQGSVEILGTAKDFSAEDLTTKDGFTPPSTDAAGFNNTYKITINSNF